MLGIQVQRGVHRSYPGFAWRFAVQEVQEMSTNRIIIRFNINPFAIDGKVIPIQQSGTKTRHQAINNVSRFCNRMLLFFL